MDLDEEIDDEESTEIFPLAGSGSEEALVVDDVGAVGLPAAAIALFTDDLVLRELRIVMSSLHLNTQ